MGLEVTGSRYTQISNKTDVKAKSWNRKICSSFSLVIVPHLYLSPNPGEDGENK